MFVIHLVDLVYLALVHSEKFISEDVLVHDFYGDKILLNLTFVLISRKRALMQAIDTYYVMKLEIEVLAPIDW